LLLNMVQDIEEKIEIPAGVQVRIDQANLVVEGKNGKIERRMSNPIVKLGIKDGVITISASKITKREKAIVGSWRAHIKNMMAGVQEKYTYRLKICSGHFPMTVTLKGSEFSVKNYIGEKVPRILKIKPGVEVKVEGDMVVIHCPDKELGGQTAASIEKLTSRSAYDKRVFQDGIYITEKAGKEIR
jgi:large subunit ribosomal protein L6